MASQYLSVSFSCNQSEVTVMFLKISMLRFWEPQRMVQSVQSSIRTGGLIKTRKRHGVMCQGHIRWQEQVDGWVGARCLQSDRFMTSYKKAQAFGPDEAVGAFKMKGKCWEACAPFSTQVSIICVQYCITSKFKKIRGMRVFMFVEIS